MTETRSTHGIPYGPNSQPSETYQFLHSPIPFDCSWFENLGATNHITSNLNNLSLHSPYYGGDKVTIGNDKSLPITSVGTTQFSSLVSVPNVLHVPQIKKNLISVS